MDAWTFSSPRADGSACIARGSTYQPCLPVKGSASRKSTRAFGSSASCPTISGTSTWSRRLCNPSTTRSARGCHLCLRYDLSPMCPGWTIEALAEGVSAICMELARYIRCLENQWPLTHNPTHNRRLEFITLASARPAAREPPRRLIGLLMPLAADDTGTGEPRIMARASPVTIPEVNLVEWRLLNPPHPSVLTSSHSDRLDATWIVRRERSGGNDPGERTPGRTKRSLRPGCLATVKNHLCCAGLARASKNGALSQRTGSTLPKAGRGATPPLGQLELGAPCSTLVDHCLGKLRDKPYEGLIRHPRTVSLLPSTNPHEEKQL